MAARRPTAALFAHPRAGRAITFAVYTRLPSGEPGSSLPLASQVRECERAAAEIGAQAIRGGAPTPSPTQAED